jgi:LysR family transcriptional regulator, hypochlorite-specific transcription factor HypT
MELKWLEDFVCLVKTGSFSKASHLRNVTQPAFSRRIRALEDWVGAMLIDRSSYPVTPTSFGEKFLPYAEETLKSSNSIREDFRILTRPQPNLLRIVTLHSLSIYFLPEVVERIHRAQEAVRVVVISSVQGIESHFDTLVNGMAEFLVTWDHEAVHANLSGLNELERKRIGTDTLMPVVSVRFAERHGLRDLRDPGNPVPFLAYTGFSFSDKIVASAVKSLGERLRVVSENGLSESLRALVKRDLGLAWLPRDLIAGDLHAGELVCVGSGDLVIDLEIAAYRNRENASPVMEEIWGLL